MGFLSMYKSKIKEAFIRGEDRISIYIMCEFTIVIYIYNLCYTPYQNFVGTFPNLRFFDIDFFRVFSPNIYMLCLSFTSRQIYILIRRLYYNLARIPPRSFQLIILQQG
jgi:hypothetical protein